MSVRFSLCLVLAFGAAVAGADAQDKRDEDSLAGDALAAAKLATTFLTDRVSTHGGYLWRYSSDLTLREGEGVVQHATVWVQPPGTPTIGESYLRLYDATGDEQFLSAARRVGEALRRGQMRSGGWQAHIEFDQDRRKKWAYRIDPLARKAKDQSSLDDDKTQSALRFVIRLDRALQFQDDAVHEMAMYALDNLIAKGQMPGGGFPQVWTDQVIEGSSAPDARASFPDDWPRDYPGHGEYWHRATLNDNLAPDVLSTLFLADEVYGSGAKSSRENTGDAGKYRAAALRFADWILSAQLPAPQPAWAQQYSFAMQPIWARKFEPPAVTGGESQGVIATLIDLYERTGDKKYLQPIPAALDYLESSQLPGKRLARFYELKTNRPLYFTTDYELTYDDDDLPTHYSFTVPSRIESLRRRYEKLIAGPTGREAAGPKPRKSDVDAESIRRIIDAQDDRGAWVTDGGLRYHRADQTSPSPVIEMKVTAENLNRLAAHLASRRTGR